MHCRTLTSFLLLSLASLWGCVSTRIYTPVDYCKVAPDPGMARVKIARANSFAGGGVYMEVLDSGQPIGLLGPGGEICWDRHPGKAEIIIVTKGGIGGSITLRCAELEAVAGQQYARVVGGGSGCTPVFIEK